MANEPGGTPTLATYVRERREALGLTRAELAARAHLAPSTILRYERGIRHLGHPSTLLCLATALGVPVEALARRPRRAVGEE